MKRKFILSILMALTFLCSWCASAQAVSISLKILNPYITVGDNFDVEVWVDGEGIGEELLGFGFDVTSSLSWTNFSYDGYTLGNPLLDDSFTSGGYDVEASAFPGISDDDILLTTLSFTALTEGTDSLKVFGEYVFPLNSGLFYEISGLTVDKFIDITVSAASVPEPATILLLSAGLFGFGAIRRKNRFPEH